MARTLNPETQKAAMAGLIEAGVRAIAEQGIDQISVNSVSQAANTSRPTFYAYFGDINGLLAEIWLAKSKQWLTELSDFERPTTKFSPEASDLNRAMTEILAASHRIPEVEELVRPSMQLWWDEISKTSQMNQLKVIWLIGERLGVTLTDLIDPKVLEAQFIEAIIKAIPNDKAGNGGVKFSLPPVSEPDIVDENLESRLLKAAIEIISTGGVKSASMARVARKTQVSTGAVYPRYAKVDDLIEGSFDVAVGKVVEQNFALLQSENFTPEDFGLFVMAGLTPSRRVWRNFRIEIHLGSRGKPALTKRLAESIRLTNASVATKLTIYKKPELTSGPIPYLIHCIGIGLAMLQNAGVPVGELDHRQISKAMVGPLALQNA